MTAVVLGKPDAETLSAPQFKALLEALMDAGYVTLAQLEPGIDELMKSDLTCERRTDDEDALAKESRGGGLYDSFKAISFSSVADVIAHYERYPIFKINFEMDLYDWTKIEGDYGYKLVLEPSHPLRVLQEVVIDAANEGNDLIWDDDAPMAEVMYFAISQFGLYIDLLPCPPDMHETLANQPRYAAIKALLAGVFGVEPHVYTLDES